MDLDAEDELGVAEVFDAVLASEPILDAGDLALQRRDEQEVVHIQGDVVELPPPPPWFRTYTQASDFVRE